MSKTATRIRFIGTEVLTSHEVGAVTGEGDLLVPGVEYEVPAEFAEHLLATSPHFELVTSTKAKAKEGSTDA